MAKPLPPKPPMPPRPAYPTSPQSTSRGGTLLGLFIGLVVGVLIAFGVVWFLNKSPLPFLNKHEPPVKNDKTEKDAEAAAPLPLPGKPGDKPKDKQRFEFYGILEGKQPANGGAATTAATTVTMRASTTTRSTPTTTATQAEDAAAATAAIEAKEPPAKEIFYLQAGAFQKAVDADQLRAKLALTGLETSVQEITIRDKGAMHRVRSGPFHSHEEMNRARNQLAQIGIQTTIIKQKE